MRLLALTIGLAFAATPALANDAQPVDADAGKKVCKSVNRTGSIVPKRICKTQAEWDQLAEATQMMLRGITGTGAINGSAPQEKPIFPNGQ